MPVELGLNGLQRVEMLYTTNNTIRFSLPFFFYQNDYKILLKAPCYVFKDPIKSLNLSWTQLFQVLVHSSYPHTTMCTFFLMLSKIFEENSSHTQYANQTALKELGSEIQKI